MKKLFFLGACLVAFASQPGMAQTGGAETIVVRLQESAGRIYVVTATGSGKAEVSEVPIAGLTHKYIVPVTEVYQQTLSKYSQQGYTLKGMSGGDLVTTLVFMKEK
jgi:hypothetical protein